MHSAVKGSIWSLQDTFFSTRRTYKKIPSRIHVFPRHLPRCVTCPHAFFLMSLPSFSPPPPVEVCGGYRGGEGTPASQQRLLPLMPPLSSISPGLMRHTVVRFLPARQQICLLHIHILASSSMMLFSSSSQQSSLPSSSILLSFSFERVAFLFLRARRRPCSFSRRLFPISPQGYSSSEMRRIKPHKWSFSASYANIAFIHFHKAAMMRFRPPAGRGAFTCSTRFFAENRLSGEHYMRR